MKIGIHHNKSGFSTRWIAYCEKVNIPYKIVDCYASDIIQQLNDCDALLWHFHQENYRDTLFAKQLIVSIEAMGKSVFPDSNSCWHFDDKVGQKYLLEAAGAPLVPSYVFYDRKRTLDWLKSTTFPKVFKLRGGAGSANVKLVRSLSEASKLTSRAFGRGFSSFNRLNYLKERIRKYRLGKDSFLGVLKGIGRIFIPTEFAKFHGREKGYAYFQDFIPDNRFDIRVITIGNKAFGLKRMVRENDFRASGSGHIIYDHAEIPADCIKIAFDTSDKLGFQCMAYDFVRHTDKQLIVEISFGFAVKAYDHCPGYWDKSMTWHQGSFVPQEWMVEHIVNNSLK